MIHNHLFVTHISQDVSGDHSELSLNYYSQLSYEIKHSIQLPNNFMWSCLNGSS